VLDGVLPLGVEKRLTLLVRKRLHFVRVSAVGDPAVKVLAVEQSRKAFRRDILTGIVGNQASRRGQRQGDSRCQ
jgi:hypothetical protein